MRRPGETPSQTVGPYFHLGLAAPGERVLAGPDVPGRRIRIEGQVLDGDRRPVEDALLELWQANAAGRYRHPLDDREELPLDEGFLGYGRCSTDFRTGLYAFETIAPGRVPHPDGGLQAPHLSLVVQARGMLLPSFTRIYLGDEAEANATDPLLAALPPERAATLIAAPVSPGTYRFDVRFQGDDETVFLDV
ncbi:MAG: protocatechuate 3,4-dioxygenase subunit alpha [Thermoleophilia bacterium]